MKEDVKSGAVEIRQVGNGYLVMPPTDFTRGECRDDSRLMVFQSFEELGHWLEQHFTHRSSEITPDKA